HPIAITHIVQRTGLKGNIDIALLLEHSEHALAATLAVARGNPLFSGGSGKAERTVTMTLFGYDGPLKPLQIVCDAMRNAQSMVDRPANLLNTSQFLDHAKAVAKRFKDVSLHSLRGPQLLEQGLGGMWAVGKAAQDPPTFIVLDYAPPEATQQICWVGKGIVYDTGGLSIKTKTSMPSMKTDMAGAAAVLGAFAAAVELEVNYGLCAILCVAENAVGPNSIRPDDIITLYSGRTVEVANTDAEGRLVLADGVAWAVKNRSPDLLIDIATLTGAQPIATGKRHGALYCNDEELEALALKAGRYSGDLVHALPYCPEFYRKEYASAVADMRNTVKDRANAQTSCAGQFIGNHIAKFNKPWLHIDMAGPSKANGRATGYGVGLLLALAEVI
ncbi:MAG: leucyl aminopeptidase family protein, partial [Proteobacteria bacterium]|nr:leucyl aminopeptidase family protein [Pseudomonadota bacterium]